MAAKDLQTALQLIPANEQLVSQRIATATANTYKHNSVSSQAEFMDQVQQKLLVRLELFVRLMLKRLGVSAGDEKALQQELHTILVTGGLIAKKAGKGTCVQATS